MNRQSPHVCSSSLPRFDPAGHGNVHNPKKRGKGFKHRKAAIVPAEDHQGNLTASKNAGVSPAPFFEKKLLHEEIRKTKKRMTLGSMGVMQKSRWPRYDSWVKHDP